MRTKPANLAFLMPAPADPIAHVKALHKSYESRTGYTIRWNPHRERQWSEWCRWADWEWTDRELAIVIGYLRGKIAKGERNDGALKFENLIGSPDRFEEDLNLANEARRTGGVARPKPTGKGYTPTTPAEAVTGKEGVNLFKSLLAQNDAEESKR